MTVNASCSMRHQNIGPRAAHFEQWVRDRLLDREAYIHEHGQDMPEIHDRRWTPLK